MSLFLVLLAAGDSKRLKSNTPKPYNVVNNKTVIEHSLDAFKNFNKIVFKKFKIRRTSIGYLN